VKLDSDKGLRPELPLEDFVVSDETVRLVNNLDEMERGILRRVEVHSGIPRRIVISAAGATGPRGYFHAGPISGRRRRGPVTSFKTPGGHDDM
jgi:hypothetical protein